MEIVCVYILCHKISRDFNRYTIGENILYYLKFTMTPVIGEVFGQLHFHKYLPYRINVSL